MITDDAPLFVNYYSSEATTSQLAVRDAMQGGMQLIVYKLVYDMI